MIRRKLRGLFTLAAPHRRRSNSTVTADVSDLLESRMLLSGVAIYPQPVSAAAVAPDRSSQQDVSPPDDSRIGTHVLEDVFKVKVKYTVSNSGQSPVEIDVTTLYDRDGDGFAKVYSSKIPPQKTKGFKVKAYSSDLLPDETLAVDLRSGNQVLMDGIRFTVLDEDAPNPDGEKWGVKIYKNRQLDIAYLNGQAIWSVNPFHK